ncbi:hypothetical protein ACJZ2D_010039 [Fusarium nematophilum]
MATQARERTISRPRQRSALVRPLPPSDTFHQALCSVEVSHDSFISAISRFIGRLYVVSQPQQDFSFVVERSTACGKDLVLTVQHTWQRLSINDQSIWSLTISMTEAMQNLVSMVDTLKVDNELVSIPASDFSLLFSRAMNLVRVAITLVSGARAVLRRLNCRQRELRTRGQASAAVNDISAPSGPQNRPQTDEGLHRPLPAFPQCSASLGPRSIRSTRGTSMGSSQVEVKSGSPKQEVPPPNPSPQAALRQKDNVSMSKHDLSGTANAKRRSKASTRASQSGTCKPPLQKRTWPATIHKRTDGVQDCHFAAKGQPIKRLSPINGISEACRQSGSGDLLSPSWLHFNKDGEVTGGTLEGLVEYLTARRSAYDKAFQYTFYLTFRLFCTPKELAEKLTERFHRASKSTVANDIQLRVCHVFQHWLEVHWRLETDQEALRIIESFSASTLSSIIPAASQTLTRIKHLPDQALPEPRPWPSAVQGKPVVVHHGSLKTSRHRAQLSDAIKHQWGILKASRNSKNSSSLLSFGCIAFARQLSIKQTTLLCRIPPHELVGCEWMCKDGDEAPNIRAMVAFTNQLSKLVVETILESRTASKRAAAVEHWINIAQECSNLGNYDGLTALLSGLCHSAIARLHQTWNVVSPKILVILGALQALIEPSHNHKSLRALLKTHEPPCLPFLGIYLTDLAFLNMAHPSTKPSDPQNKHAPEQPFINFAKYSRTAKIGQESAPARPNSQGASEKSKISSFWERAYQDIIDDEDRQIRKILEAYDVVLERAKRTDGATSDSKTIHPADTQLKSAGADAKESEDDPSTERENEDYSSESELSDSGSISTGPPTERVVGDEAKMRDVVKRSLEEMQQKEWVLRWHGHVFEVRDQVTRIVGIVQKMSGFVSPAAGLNPYSGLAWAGVCVLLPMIISDTEERQTAIDGVSRTTQLTARYKTVEEDYLRGMHGENEDFENALVALYRHITLFYVKATCYFAKSILKRMLRGVATLDDWASDLADLTEADKECQAFVTGLGLSASLKKSDQILEKLNKLETNDQIDRIKGWLLSDVDVDKQQLDKQDKLGSEVKYSGRWLLDSDEFKEWEDSTSAQLWISGSIGTGKTSLVSIVVDSLRSLDIENVAFFYYSIDIRNTLQTPDTSSRLEQVFRGLVGQLAMSPDKTKVSEEVEIAFEDAVKRGTLQPAPLGWEGAKNLLIKIVASRRNTTIIIVGIDEFPEFAKLLKQLKAIYHAVKPGKLRLLLSSQTVVPVSEYFPSTTLMVAGGEKSKLDMRAFIERRVELFRAEHKKALTQTVADDMVDTLSEKAEGMFKWADLCLKQVLYDDDTLHIHQNWKSVKDQHFRGLLVKLIDSYEQLYEKSLSKGYSKQRKSELENDAKRILFWVMEGIFCTIS